MFSSLSKAVLLVAVLCSLNGCAGRKLPKYEKPLARATHQKVRTTAYTHTESDHLKHGARNAMGTRLQAGPIHSAAADWSRWPAGTTFRLLETGEIFRVDDYGWALAGTNTIDLYKTSKWAMNRWGVRRVNIEILEWGSIRRSERILEPRRKHRHVKLMLKQIRDRYADGEPPAPERGVSERTYLAATSFAPAPEPAPAPVPVAAPVVAVPATAVAAPAGTNPQLKPFYR